MKKHKLFLVFLGVCAALLLASAAVFSVYYDGHFTNVGVRGLQDFKEQSTAPGSPDSDNIRAYALDDGSGNTLLRIKNSSGNVNTIAGTLKYIQLPLTAFVVETGGNGSTVGTATAPLTASTTPGMEMDDNMLSIVWADGETSPIQVTFRVPDDYVSGGIFKVIATESGTSTANQVDFDVYVNSDGTASDSAATDQTPVALAGTSSTPDEVTLTPATDFSALSAGKWVTLRLWRDDVATGTNDLELKGVVFSYR